MSKELLSDVSYVRLSLGESNGERVKVRGEFAKCGVATENKRVYPGPIWEKEIKRLNKALKERRVFGEVDHPSDGQTKLARVSHVVTNLSIKDGLVIGEAEILPTDAGKNLLALLQANVPVGVSSRGFGSVKSNDKNEDVVQEDYKLVTFDFVADPADVDAYPQVAESRGLFEGVEFEADDEQEKAIEFARRIESEKTGKQAEKQDSTREAFAKEILGNLATLRAEAREEARKELLNDPSVAGAKLALESLRSILKPFVLPEDVAGVVAEKDATIQKLQNEFAEQALKLKSLEEENASLAKMAKEVGYRFYLERILSGDNNAEAVRNLVGDVTVFENSDALKARVEAIKAEMSKKSEETQQVAEAKAKEVAESKASEKRIRDEFASKLAELERRMVRADKEREELEEQLIEARSDKKELEAKLYAEQRLANHPKASKLRGLVEAAGSKRETVEALVESEREPIRDSDDLQEVRARIRSKMRGGGREYAAEEMTEGTSSNRVRKSQNDDYLGLGMSLDSLKRLSGIGNKQ